MKQAKTKSINLMFFLCFIVIWVVLVIFNFIIPNKTFSEAENRELKKIPHYSLERLLSGDYLNDMDVFINDHFIGRSIWISLNSKLEYALGKREINGIYIAKNAMLEKIAPPNSTDVDRNIEGIKVFAESFDKPIYIGVIPSATEIYKENLPLKAETWDQKALIDSVYSSLEGAATPINVYDTLLSQKDEYIFYRTDHHYTTYGAYLAYTEVAKTIGLPVHPVEDYKIENRSEEFQGTFHSKTWIDFIKPDVLSSYSIGETDKLIVREGGEETSYDSIYFEDFLDKKDKYSFFLGQNKAVVTIKTKSESGRKLLMFKDSYSHCFAPLLMEEYSEITLLDLRYLNSAVNKIVNLDEYDELLILYSIDFFVHNNDLIKLKLYQ